MNDPRPIPWMTRKVLIGLGSITLAVIAFVSFRTGSPAPILKDGIPIPFASSSSLQGDVIFSERRGAFDVYRVTFPIGTNSAELHENKIYLIEFPAEPTIVDGAPFDNILKELTTSSHDVDYFLYTYSPNATQEKRDINAIRFKDRFSGGKFAASPKARRLDSTRGNALLAFEKKNDITFYPTDGSIGSALLSDKGLIVALVINEKDGGVLTPRDAGLCGNGAKDGIEQCDGGILCSSDCTMKTPIPFDDDPIAPGIQLTILGQAMTPATGTVPVQTTDVSLLQFSVRAESDDITVRGFSFTETEGALIGNAEHYRLLVDTNDDGTVDTPVGSPAEPSDGIVRFDVDRVIPHGTSQRFEVRADIVDAPESQTLGIQFATLTSDVVSADLTIAHVPLSGVKTNGTCVQPFCQIVLTTAPGRLWTIETDSGDGTTGGTTGGDEGTTGGTTGGDTGGTTGGTTGGDTGGTTGGTTGGDSGGGDAVCGNGMIEGTETCDDNGTESGDGCSDACATEDGFTCTGEPSVCLTYVDYTDKLADGVIDGYVSDTKNLLLAMKLMGDLDKPFSDVSEDDINGDGTFDSVDMIIFMDALTILTPDV